jgi:glycosyltransferase involved in cell wall biosynthesis
MMYVAAAHGVSPTVIPELGRSLNPLRDVMTAFKLFRLIRSWKPAVVHTHTAKAGFVGRVAARLAGVAVVVHTFHGHVFHGYFGSTATRVFLVLERLAARCCDAIIANTEGLRTELSETYRIAPKTKIHVSPLAVDLEPFLDTPRKQGRFRSAWRIPSAVPLVGIVGRLVPVKNHALFVSAAVLVRRRRPDARFAIVGDGETRPAIERQVEEAGLRDAVTFTGWTRDLASIYSDLDVSVISSHNEGVPGAITEALCARCPVVSTAVGGVPELLEHGAVGLLVPPGDVEALADAILRALDAPPDVERGREAALRRSGLPVILGQLDDLYTRLLRAKGVVADPASFPLNG